MPPQNDESYHTSAMVDAVQGMAQKLEQYTQHADVDRKKLRNEVNATVEAMRKDVHAVISRIQLDASQHRDEHSAERQERATDAVERLNRQLTINLWMGALTALVVLNLLLIGFVVARVAWVMYGR